MIKWLRTVFKMEEDLIEFHGTCGLKKASNLMKTLVNILKLKYNSVDAVSYTHLDVYKRQTEN